MLSVIKRNFKTRLFLKKAVTFETRSIIMVSAELMLIIRINIGNWKATFRLPKNN